MTAAVYRANLKVSSMPMLSELHGRSVIVRGQDQNVVPNMVEKSSLTDADTALGIPQIYYCHNVVPNAHGYQSVGYEFHKSPAAGSEIFTHTLNLRDSAGNLGYLGVTASGELAILERTYTEWAINVTDAPDPATILGKRASVAFVSGVTYIYFANVGCYTYDFTTHAFTAVTLAGVVAADIIGIAGAFGYLLVYSVDSIAWSSTVDPTDFAPSLSTGAGGGQVEGSKGTITTIETVYGALIIFTSGNAVAGIHSNNVRYPFTFTEIAGSGGLSDPNFVSYDAGSGSIYAYTTSGMQSITARQAVNVFSEVTDFLSGQYLEIFNEDTLELEQINISGVIQKRLVVVNDRYLIISYGSTTALTHALYYDTSYKQWGRLKVDHADCFEYQLYDQTLFETPRKSIGFLKADGSIYSLDLALNNISNNGVMILGKFQFVRTRLLTLQSAELENINAGASFHLYDYPSLDGKNWEDPVIGYLATDIGKYREYSFRTTGINHSLLWKGSFNAVSLVLSFTANGGR